MKFIKRFKDGFRKEEDTESEGYYVILDYDDYDSNFVSVINGSIEFTESEISKIKSLDLKKRFKNCIINQRSFGGHGFQGFVFGNFLEISNTTTDMQIYHTEDDWYYVKLNLLVDFAVDESKLMLIKCDQFDGLIRFLNNLKNYVV